MKKFLVPVILTVWAESSEHAVENVARDLKPVCDSSETATEEWELVKVRQDFE